MQFTAEKISNPLRTSSLLSLEINGIIAVEVSVPYSGGSGFKSRVLTRSLLSYFTLQHSFILMLNIPYQITLEGASLLVM